MAEIATIARPYAQALYKIAKANTNANGLDAWSTVVTELAEISAHPEMVALAKNPNLSTGQLQDLVLAALKSVPDDEAKRFIAVLIDNHRFVLMPEIAEQFFALKNAGQGAGEVEISSAFPLDEQQLADTLAVLEKKFGKTLKPKVKVDADLIGGLRIQIGDEVLDTSVRARLAAMQNTLIA